MNKNSIYTLFVTLMLLSIFTSSSYAGNSRAGAGPGAGPGQGPTAGPGPNAGSGAGTSSGLFPDIEPTPTSSGSDASEQLANIAETTAGKVCLNICSDTFQQCVAACPEPQINMENPDVEASQCMINCVTEFESCYAGC